MDIINVPDITTREGMYSYLKENHDKLKEFWIRVNRSPEPCSDVIGYVDAVEVALCFGWIDSTIKHIDETHRAQHFTPRKKGSPYSRPNIERLIWLEKQNMLTDEIRESVLPLIKAPYEFPEDIIAAIKENTETWKNYQNFPEGYKRIRIAYIDAARNRPEEFKKRLESFIKKTHRNVLIKGFGGIDKYYSLP